MHIHLRDYPVQLNLGVYPEERSKQQTVLISVQLFFLQNLGPGVTDDLDRTINYEEIVTTIERIFSGKEFRLVETLVEKLGSEIIYEYAALEKVSVQVQKIFHKDSPMRGATILASKDFFHGRKVTN